MADSWEDWEESNVPLPPKKAESVVEENATKPRWTEENFEGFKEEKKRLEKLAELHPHYAAQKESMPQVIIKKRDPSKPADSQAPVTQNKQIPSQGETSQLSLQERERLYEEKRRQLFGKQ